MLDLAVKLQMLQERYKSNAEQGYVSALKDAHERIVGKLASTDGEDAIKRLKAIRALIEDEIGQLYESVKPDLKDDMQGFAELEHKTLFNYMNETNGLGYAFVALPKDTIKEVLDFDAVIPMGDKGYSVNDFFDTASQAHINRYKQIIAGGLASNDGYRAITKRLKEADATGTMQLSSIVHTAISAARDRANVKTYESFDDVIIGWKSIATLDSRVSAVCASLDGVTYMKPKFSSYDKIPNKPPRHINCRSILRGLTKLDEEGLRPQNGDTKSQVSSNTKFPDWFANQSKDFQRKWLGESRYQLYKDGRLDIKSFVDVKSGRLFTLDEIKAEMGAVAKKIEVPNKFNPEFYKLSEAERKKTWNEWASNADFGKDPKTIEEAMHHWGTYKYSDYKKEFANGKLTSKTTQLMDEAFKLEGNHDGSRIFRGISVENMGWDYNTESYSIDNSSYIKYLSSLKEGDMLSDITPTSFSKELSVAKTYAINNWEASDEAINVLFRADKVTKNGYDISALSNHQDEVEVLVAPNSKFKITKITDTEDDSGFKIRIIDMEIQDE